VGILQPVSGADDRLGSKCEELEPSISGPLLPSRADVRANVPVGRIRAGQRKSDCDGLQHVKRRARWNNAVETKSCRGQ
jgi:hypothetical protein